MSGSSKQDPLIKGNPFMAAWDEQRRRWLVQSASGERRYAVNPTDGRCSCGSSYTCWHLGIIPLAEEIDHSQAAARSYYASWRLADLRAEDARLRAIVTSAAGDAVPAARRAWFERAQLSVVGDEILDRLVGAEVAA